MFVCSRTRCVPKEIFCWNLRMHSAAHITLQLRVQRRAKVNDTHSSGWQQKYNLEHVYTYTFGIYPHPQCNRGSCVEVTGRRMRFDRDKKKKRKGNSRTTELLKMRVRAGEGVRPTERKIETWNEVKCSEVKRKYFSIYKFCPLLSL